VVVGERIVVIGGSNDSADVPTVEAYDPASDRWSPGLRLREGVSAAGAVVTGGSVH